MAGARKRAGRQGGAGTAAGIDFQSRLAAQLACAILAEKHASPLWGWPDTLPLEAIQLETREHVDDIRVLTTANSAYIQAKLRLNLSTQPGSDLGKALVAIAEQYLEGLTDGDRLVLAVGPHSSRPITDDLPRLLERIRGMPLDGSLNSIAATQAERNAMGALRVHLTRAWQDRRGVAPGDTDLCDLLRFVHVSVHDLGDDGAATHAAKNQLRATVLDDPTQAGQAWNNLVAISARFASQQSGADRQRLFEMLATKGIGLRAAPSYRADIDRLRTRSADTLRALERLSRISPPGGERFKIERSVPKDVLAAATSGSILVTGEPGAGKSASIFELATALVEAGRDVVVIAADAIEVGGLGQLREELGLTHEVLDVLRNWPGSSNAVLIIDGLDAARGEGTQQALLDLIAATQTTTSRWHVAASIRRFDLRYNRKLRDLFPIDAGAPVPDTHISAEFAAIRHISVPTLTNLELDQLEALAPTLHGLLDGAPADLRDLARVPFNLKLLADLALLNVDHAALEPLSTQVQLLDLYWELRVIGVDGQGDARSAVIHEIVTAMVAARRLHAERQPVARPETSGALNRLLSEAVLAEMQSESGSTVREILTFSHHVLFDYAVERSLFRGTEERLSRAILDDPDLLLFARPSVELYFRSLWERDPQRHLFWTACLDLAATEGVPQIGRIVGPTVASELARSINDLRGLLDELSVGEAERAPAEIILRHFVGAAIGSEPQPFWRGATARTAWSVFASELAELEMTPTVTFALRRVVSELAERPTSLDEDQLSHVGHAARTLLAHVLDLEVADRGLTWPAIEAVAATYSSNPDSSRQQLSRILDKGRLERFGYSEMPDLAHQVEDLLTVDPDFVRDIYVAAFSFEEESKETTHMGGRILSLSSHRRQDYAHSHYALAKAYPKFISQALVPAIEALIAVRAAYGQRRFSESYGAVLRFPWDAKREARVIDDGSSIWDRDPLGHDDEVKILNSFEKHLDSLAEQRRDDLGEVVDVLLEYEVPSSIWRRLLLVVARHSDELGSLLSPLVIAPAALASPVLGAPLGEFLRAGFLSLDPETRVEVEKAIMAIPTYLATANPGDQNSDRRAASKRDRLLGCLSPDTLTDAEARAHLEQLIDDGSVPENYEPTVEAGWRSNDDWRREELVAQGVDVDSAPNRRIAELEEEVHEFAREHLNGSPSVASVQAILDPLRKLSIAIERAEEEGADSRQADQAFGIAAEAAEAITRGELRDHEAFSLASTILLAAANHGDPAPRPEADGDFDDSPSWGGPAPRVEAAAGLLMLATDSNWCTPELLDAIDDLSRDPHPAVRFNLARRLSLLRINAPEAMWEIAERAIAEDGSLAVVQAVLCEMPRMPQADPVRLREVAETLLSQTPRDAPGGASLRQTAISLLVDLHVWEGDGEAGEFLRRNVIAHVTDGEEGTRQMVVRLRDIQTYADEDKADSDAIRGRAVALVEDTARKALEDFEEVNARLSSMSPDDPDLERARNAAKMIDTIASELYFASGAYKGNGNEEPAVSPEQAQRLYQEAGTTIDLLASAPIPSATHHVVETLEAFVEFDPRGVFIRLARTIEGGKAGGYHFDSMAVDLFVALIERYLAEYRTLLQSDEELRTLLIAMLDIFVDAGWPKARQLTYGLHELFR